MSRAIDDLKHEHDVILIGLRILDGMCQRIQSGEPIERGDMKAFLGFLGEFADKCHHGKEEDHLFPAMVNAGVKRDGGPIGAMLQEHAQGREWISKMTQSLDPALDPAEFVSAARGYADLLRAHIQKENDVLFPTAERILTSERLQALYRAFEEHEEKVIGGGRHEQLHGLLKEMKAKYAAQDNL
jgi:hemerythrin-like domain-containing protein